MLVVINPIPLLINFTSFAQLQIKDKLRTFPRREGFTRNKEKVSSLICFGPFVPYPIRPSPSGKASISDVVRFPSSPFHHLFYVPVNDFRSFVAGLSLCGQDGKMMVKFWKCPFHRGFLGLQ